MFDFRKGVFYQKCHDPDCHMVDYKSEEVVIPVDINPIMNDSDFLIEEFDDSTRDLCEAVDLVEYEQCLHNSDCRDLELEESLLSDGSGNRSEEIHPSSSASSGNACDSNLKSVTASSIHDSDINTIQLEISSNDIKGSDLIFDVTVTDKKDVINPHLLFTFDENLIGDDTDENFFQDKFLLLQTDQRKESSEDQRNFLVNTACGNINGTMDNQAEMYFDDNFEVDECLLSCERMSTNKKSDDIKAQCHLGNHRLLYEHEINNSSAVDVSKFESNLEYEKMVIASPKPANPVHSNDFNNPNLHAFNENTFYHSTPMPLQKNNRANEASSSFVRSELSNFCFDDEDDNLLIEL